MAKTETHPTPLMNNVLVLPMETPKQENSMGLVMPENKAALVDLAYGTVVAIGDGDAFLTPDEKKVCRIKLNDVVGYMPRLKIEIDYDGKKYHAIEFTDLIVKMPEGWAV